MAEKKEADSEEEIAMTERGETQTTAATLTRLNPPSYKSDVSTTSSWDTNGETEWTKKSDFPRRRRYHIRNGD